MCDGLCVFFNLYIFIHLFLIKVKKTQQKAKNLPGKFLNDGGGGDGF